MPQAIEGHALLGLEVISSSEPLQICRRFFVQHSRRQAQQRRFLAPSLQISIMKAMRSFLVLACSILCALGARLPFLDLPAELVMDVNKA